MFWAPPCVLQLRLLREERDRRATCEDLISWAELRVTVVSLLLYCTVATQPLQPSEFTVEPRICNFVVAHQV